MFTTNEIISFQEASHKDVTERILWIDDGYVICYTIDITQKNALPLKRKISDLEEMLEQKLLLIITDEPYAFVYQSEEQIAATQKEVRDERWELIGEIATMEPEIYDKEKRGRLIKELLKKSGKKNKNLYYHLLRQYWQRGKMKNTLLPDYRNSGGRGKERTLGVIKTGRPRKYEAALGEGINVDDEMKRIFHVSIKKFYHTTKKNPLTFSYEMMLKTWFAENYVYENGVKLPILKDKSQLPTFRQYQYWYQKTYNVEEKHRKRKGDRKFELEHRAVLGSSVGEMYGPGTKYQIDATVADVYLISSYNRNWIVGRPVVYRVMDVFSRMIVGLYVGLEGPSWIGAMMAIANTASNKVEYCKRYGIDITPEEWNVNHLPQTLLADRGELEGYNVERLITAFHLKVENTAPYRADWKGIIEQNFRTTNIRAKPFLPGFVDKEYRARGDKDYRLDAKLTIDEFTEIMIRCALYHNNHWLEDYNPDEMMITDEVNLIPKDLWNWGIKNRSGRLRSYPEDIVKLYLLPQERASVTFRGIVFKGMKYSCEKALREGWFTQAREKSWRIQVAFDPRDTSYIYLPSEDGKSYEICTLLDHQKCYWGRPLYDVEYLNAYEELEKQNNAHSEMQRKIDLNSQIEHVVNGANKKSQTDKIPMSNHERTKGIKQNKAFEKEARRKEEAFLLVNYDAAETDGVIATNTTEEWETFKPKNKLDLLRQKQKELMNNGRNKPS